MKVKRYFTQPLLFPIFFFALAIFAGAFCLSLPVSQNGGQGVSYTDALFTATSATCVTGLTVVDIGTTFSKVGQMIIIFLIQIGGLGIMTLTTLAIYLFRQRVTLTDRVAVGQNLLQDPRFRLGSFLLRIVLWTFSIELIGAALFYLVANGEVSFAAALFHAISAFCNAGFALYGDSLSRWYNDPAVNLIFISLITLGGIGFYVLVETSEWVLANTFKRNRDKRVRLSWYSKVVLQTSFFLVIGGTVVIFLSEFVLQKHQLSLGESLLASLFQSVSCRTAGFNTIPIGQLTNVTMLLMMILMFIGAAPGSCGGGIKVTSFRVVLAFIAAELRGREQAVINGMAITRDSVRRAIAILVFSLFIVGVAILAISITDTGNLTHNESRGHFLNIAFEVVSAYGTAGISTGITPDLSQIDKYIIMCLMYLGRLGPLIFLGVLHTIRRPELFSRPETDILMG